MTVLRRAFAVCVSAAVLGLQLAVILPPSHAYDSRMRYWPFTRYPMYSWARHRGDLITSYRLTGTPCGGGPDREISNWDAGRQFWVFRDHLMRATGQASADGRLQRLRPEQSDHEAAILADLVRAHVPLQICTLHVWEQVIVLGSGEDPYEAPWELRRSWDIAPADEDGNP